MIYNNKLNISRYISVVDELVNNYFNDETGEYFPHIGNIYSVYLYFMNCVEPEDGDSISKDTISSVGEDGEVSINFDELQKLFDNEEFMSKYNQAVSFNSHACMLDFCHARKDALNLIKQKTKSANAFAIAISSSLKTMLDAFRDSFSDEQIAKMVEIATEIKDGALSEEAIIKAYEGSERFKTRTQEVIDESKIIRLPEKR